MAREILDDETKLDKSAEIYNKRTLDSEKEAAKNLDRKGKIRYFKDYYLGKILFVLFFIFILFALGKDVFLNKKTAFQVAIVDESFSTETLQMLQEELATLYEIDTEKEEVVINTDYMTASVDGLRTLTTRMYAGDIDVVIAPKKYFTQMAENGCFLYEETGTDTAFYANMPEDSKVYCVYEDGETVDPYATPFYSSGEANSKDNDNAYLFGISLQHSKKYTSLPIVTKPEDAVIGIVGTSERTDMAKRFIEEYLFE